MVTITTELINLLRGVRGNHNLRSIGYEHKYDEYQLSEYIKCKTDPKYFINNYCKIVSLDHGVVPFKTFAYQDRLLDTIHNNRFTIGKIGRQLGKCVEYDTLIKIRNKETKEIIEVKIGEFYEWQSFKKWFDENIQQIINASHGSANPTSSNTL